MLSSCSTLRCWAAVRLIVSKRISNPPAAPCVVVKHDSDVNHLAQTGIENKRQVRTLLCQTGCLTGWVQASHNIGQHVSQLGFLSTCHGSLTKWWQFHAAVECWPHQAGQQAAWSAAGTAAKAQALQQN